MNVQGKHYRSAWWDESEAALRIVDQTALPHDFRIASLRSLAEVCDASPYLLPVSVDGLIVVASVSLVELAGRIRMLEEAKLKKLEAASLPTPAPAEAKPAQ